ncbi:MAG: mevalonate kinase [Pseudomonadota bacterium]
MSTARTASAPGSIMITGEHAVVQGYPAIVAAIAQRVTVRLREVAGGALSITSEIAPPQTVSLDALVAEGLYRFVIAAVAWHGMEFAGLEIDIRSDIDPTLGLGSSAAVTVAALAALRGAAPDALHADALAIIRALQGRGSGADLAASLRGGCLAYEVGDSATFGPLPLPPALSLFNVGYKTPTGEVLARVAAAQAEDPARYDALYAQMGASAAETIARVQSDGWRTVGDDIARYQDLMADLGVSDAQLDAAIATARSTECVIGAKISGSGLGDCVVALGAVPPGFVPVTLDQKGAVVHDDAS